MAENKEGFLLYKDYIHVISHLSDEVAGQVLKLILDYVNDKDPEPQDITLKIVFEPIKRQLKRDLKKYKEVVDTKKENGMMGNLKRWNKDLYDLVTKKEMTLQEALFIADDRKTSRTVADLSQSVADDRGPIAKIADTDNVTDTGKVTVKENTIEARKLKFASTLEPFLEKYGRDMLNEFYKYWVEPNKSNTKFRQEMEKAWDVTRRLETWARKDKRFTPGNDKPQLRSYKS